MRLPLAWFSTAVVVTALAWASAIGAQTTVPPGTPQSQTPTFRSAVDRVAVDVGVIDGRGRPVDDLRLEEFSLKVDGTARRVTSAEFVSFRTGAASAPPPSRGFSTNAGQAPGRLIMLAVDEANIRKGPLAQVVAAAKAFIDGLGPSDRVGLQLLPSAGPLVDFTWDHALVKRSLDLAAGKAIEADRTSRVGVREAIDIIEHPSPAGLPQPQSALADVIDRECPGENDATSIQRCRNEIENLARMVYAEARARSIATVVSYRELIERLGATSDPKTLVLVTEGMLVGAFADVSWVEARTAAAAVSLFALRLDGGGFEATMARRSPSRNSDRDLLVDGLDLFVGLSRGMVFPVAVDPKVTFNRLGLELSGYYLLSFEPTPADRDGKTHDISVNVARPGVAVRGRRTFSLSAEGPRPIEAELVQTLRSPLPFSDFGVSVTTFKFVDGGTRQVKVLVGAEIVRPADATGPFGLAYSVADGTGKVVAADLEPAVEPTAGNVQHFTGSFLSAPGAYILKFAVVDTNGRRASVEHSFEAKVTAVGQLRLGDLLLAAAPEPGRSVRPAVDGRLAAQTVVGYTELYSDASAQLARATLAFEIAGSETGSAMATTAMRMSSDAGGNRVMGEASLPLVLLSPGDYVARVVLSSGGLAIGQVTRPFTVVAVPPAGAAGSTGAAPAAPLVPFPSRLEAFDLTPALSRPVVGFFLNRVSQPGLPDVPEALAPAIGLARTGRFAGARTIVADAGETHHVAPFLIGLAHLSAGELQQAASSFGASLQSAPTFYPAAFYLGVCYAAAGRDRDALVAWQQTMVVEPEAPWLFTLVADALLRQGDAGAALTVMRQAAGLWPASGDVSWRLAASLAGTGARVDALGAIDAWIAKFPDAADHLLAGMRILYDARVAGRAVDTPPADRERFHKYYEAYTRLAGPDLKLAEGWKQIIDR